MPSNIFSISARDILKSTLTAVAGAVLIKLGGMLQVQGFSFATADWSGLLNVAITVFVADIGRRFSTDSTGKFLGRI